jgi:hypothetical protein
VFSVDDLAAANRRIGARFDVPEPNAPAADPRVPKSEPNVPKLEPMR